ncbi:MAG: hypothetical protein BWY21_00535 [Parcubacteria group bacterium ADurb.Bin216]|nr:MAG: hypothetical protein BWY21_00535 [Parcubacteria group bacterium ADurb.Bin216]
MATIIVPAAKVLEAALAKIEAIETVRKASDAKTEAKLVYGRKFLGFSTGPKTLEEAKRKLRYDTCGTYPSAYAWDDLDHARKLLTLAQHGDPVTLNEEDCRVLF